MGPDGIGIFENEVFVGRFVISLIEVVQVLHKDAFELRSIVTTDVGWFTALFVEDTLIVYVSSIIGVSDGFGLSEIRQVAGDLVEVSQRAYDHALVVCPDWLAVICASMCI
jgi:hypothetical protein